MDSSKSNEEKVHEGNLMIAKYIGCTLKNDNKVTPKGSKYKFPHEDNQERHVNNLRYHLSYEWIMPVVERISRTKVEWDNHDIIDYHYPVTFGMINQETGNIMVRFLGCRVVEAPTLIEAAWLAVVDFIQNNTK